MMRSAVSRLDSSVYLAARLAISAVLSSSLARSITHRSSAASFARHSLGTSTVSCRYDRRALIGNT